MLLYDSVNIQPFGLWKIMLNTWWYGIMFILPSLFPWGNVDVPDNLFDKFLENFILDMGGGGGED